MFQKFNFRFLGLMLAAMLTVPATGLAQSPPLRLGVLPNISARVLLTYYQPMQEYLARELGREVVIDTATNFKTFALATSQGKYDIIVTAPNLGLVAMADDNWLPLASYEPKIPALLVALATNSDDSVQQLRGKELALANPQSLVALFGLRWLGDQGLSADKNFKVSLAANDESLSVLLRSGNTPMALMSMGEFRAKTEELRKTLRIVKVIAELPGFLVMANPKLPETDRRRLQSLIRAFPGTDLGKRFLSLSGLQNIGPVDEAGIKLLGSFVDVTRAGLKSGN